MLQGQGAAIEPRPMDRPKLIGKAKLLIGEGIEEVRFFESFLRHLQRHDIDVEDYGGIEKLGNYLHTLPTRPGFPSVTSLGITRDADKDAPRTFQSICNNLKKNELPVPASVGVAASGPRAVRVFILPGGGRPGMLEDLCMESVGGDLAVPCLRTFFECIRAAGRVPQPMSKACVHAWLASKERPDKRLGEAAQAGYWPFEHSAFDALSQFLLSL